MEKWCPTCRKPIGSPGISEMTKYAQFWRDNKCYHCGGPLKTAAVRTPSPAKGAPATSGSESVPASAKGAPAASASERVPDVRAGQPKPVSSQRTARESQPPLTEEERLARTLFALTEEMDSQYRADRQAYERTFEEVRKIGKQLCSNGGIERMRRVAYRVYYRDAAAGRVVEMCWNGICGWQS